MDQTGIVLNMISSYQNCVHRIPPLDPIEGLFYLYRVHHTGSILYITLYDERARVY